MNNENRTITNGDNEMREKIFTIEKYEWKVNSNDRFAEKKNAETKDFEDINKIKMNNILKIKKTLFKERYTK